MENVNPASSNSFRFVLTNEIKQIEFFVQSFTGLGLSLTENMQSYSSQTTKRPGDTLVYSNVSLQVLLDEDFSVFTEAYNFLMSLKNLDNEIDWNHNFTGHLFLYTNRNHLKKKFVLSECWISSIGDLTLSSTYAEHTAIILPLEIAYDFYTFEDCEDN